MITKIDHMMYFTSTTIISYQYRKDNLRTLIIIISPDFLIIFLTFNKINITELITTTDKLSSNKNSTITYQPTINNILVIMS